MCGIAGVYKFDLESDVDSERLSRMGESIKHRGPDSIGIYVFKNVGFVHTRLSILDLSENGNQPMASDDKRYIIVYNGEVYNFNELRSHLLEDDRKFKSTSDTEVILKLFGMYGVNSFKLLNGMFAISIYDTIANKLFLCRDRFGVKPLYYHRNEKEVLFGSEIKSILSYSEFEYTLNFQALSEYLWFGNPLGKSTFYDTIKEVQAGEYVIVEKGEWTSCRYFDVNEIAECEDSEDVAVGKIRMLLEKSVKSQLVSDVPVGVFLSGGIDSSAITAFASKHYAGDLQTYSIGFDFDKGNNELPIAKRVSNIFRTTHNELYITGNDLINTIERLVEAHDEPFADAANIPLYLISKQLKGKAKVVLQGDGGDEFFGGYSRYFTLTYASFWSKLLFLSKLIKLSRTKNRKLLRLHRFLEAISEPQPYYRNALLLTMECKDFDPAVILRPEFREMLIKTFPFREYKRVYNSYNDEVDDVQALYLTDVQIILKDTFFEKVDKAVMANALEVRVPFLDNELTEYMLSLPSSMKNKNGEQKYLLKKALRGIVPDEVLDGKKKGFGVPYGHWLKTSLADYFKTQIESPAAAKVLDYEQVMKMFELHQKDKGNYEFLLWKTLILAVWLNKSNVKF
jgi:asparagine synthase (glutamine-hydrolysing)